MEFVLGAELVDIKVVEELGKFGWIYSILSEISHPNPIGQRRYFGDVEQIDELLNDDTLKFYIAEGLGTMFYSGIAVGKLLKICGAIPVK